MRPNAMLRALLGACLLPALMATAQAAEIRLARQFSMGYLQLNVMEKQQLIEKHAKALGLNDVKVSWYTFNGPTAVNEALISGNIDVGSGGVPGLLVLWIENSKSKLSLDMVGKIVASPQVQWTLTPENTMKYADFMSGVGTLKVKPATWKDYFFPEIHDLKGS